ncbi:DUF6631 family protein [Sporomusa acidovorans]|uniref:Uncharacterized protein n=1 Tax=Sporomusa acidovorans (strain ATCC 49682 / DSM 3132 / Mol) TaxID=1123286 RepID=A0ABZ3IWG7_SPOA4|nr:DUF6631 family protein [Sporomusa acidovorans]OZC23656.1 hypothetical protein SPACI_05580 [Sporomusa acidovorans DSM 3132]SDE24074.1 hypothetical protein SAMN04488499_101084 [Sporomusa acidovorans]
MNDKDEMSIIFPEREVVLSQETITISPFPFGKWPKIIALATGIVGIAIEEYQKHGEALFDISLDNDRFKISPEIVNFVIRLFSEGGDDLLDILAIGANKPRSWVEALPGDDGMTLLIHVMQVNRDFFSGRVLPKFPMLTAGLATTISAGDR